MNEKEFYDLLKKIKSNDYKEEKLSLTAGFFGEDPDAFVLDDESTILLAEALKKNNFIKFVDLTGNHIGDRGAIALASVDNLESLDLYSNYIGVEGGISLAKSGLRELFLPEVHFYYKNEHHNQYQQFINNLIENNYIYSLNLYNNFLSEKLVLQLIASNKTIKILNVSVNTLSDASLEYINKNNVLEELFIGGNNITDKGIEYIQNNSSLIIIDLNKTNITDEGIKLLSKHPSIKKLSIGGCDNITSEGLQCLIGSNLEEVYVSGKKIAPEMEFYFQQAFEYVKKQKLQSVNEQEKNFSQSQIIDDSKVVEDNTIELSGNSNSNDDVTD